MLVLRRVVSRRQVWVCSVIGAMCHNIGQILVAIWMTRTPSLIVYLPVLLVSGILTGLFTGLVAQFVLQRLERAQRS